VIRYFQPSWLVKSADAVGPVGVGVVGGLLTRALLIETAGALVDGTSAVAVLDGGDAAVVTSGVAAWLADSDADTGVCGCPTAFV